MKKCLPILLCLLVLANAQQLSQIDSLVEKKMSADNIPGMALAIIDQGEFVHINSYGYRDLEGRHPAIATTSFHIASVSKIVTLLAVFQLIEANKIELSGDINTYLSFNVVNPHAPNRIVNIKELLNHRSGIVDNYDVYKPFWTEPNGDPKLDLSNFLQDYLTESGKYYSEKNFAKQDEIGSFSYSNTGFALLGLIVEEVSGVTFEDYCQEHIFKPLGMTNTSWYLKNLNLDEVANTYVYEDSLGYKFKGHNGYPDYPAGQLRTSIQDFSQFVKGYLNADSSAFVLDYSMLDRITPNPVLGHNGFHTWYLTASGNKIYYTHAGGDLGARSIIVMDVKRKNAIIIFINSEAKLNEFWRKIEQEVLAN